MRHADRPSSRLGAVSRELPASFVRKDAHQAGKPYPKVGDLSKQVITEAKKTPERAWPGEVAAVILQQSLRDLDTAYTNFFASLKGTRPR